MSEKKDRGIIREIKGTVVEETRRSTSMGVVSGEK